MSYSVIMPTINNAPGALAKACFESIEANATGELIVCASEQPQHAPDWKFVPLGRHKSAYVDCYSRLLAMLEVCSFETVFIVEHDVLYAAGYFDPAQVREDHFAYNVNLKTLTPGGYILHERPRLVTSQVMAPRGLFAEHFRRSIQWIESGNRIVWDEPGLKWCDDGLAFPTVAGKVEYNAPAPSIDVRWGGNLTGNREATQYQQQCPTWGDAAKLRTKLNI